MTPYYADDAVTIYHGDARDILPTMPPVDLVLTDPPYGIDGRYGRTELGTRGITGDHNTELLLWAADVAYVALKADGWLSVFCGYGSVGSVQDVASQAGFAVKSVIVWDKGMPSLGEGIRNQHEMIVLGRKGKPAEPWIGGNVWRLTRVTGRPVHPNEKPVELMRRFVARYSPPDGVILDPFMGSGPTLRAAKDLGRKAIGIEIEERWCEEAANRCRQEVLGLSA